MFTSVFRFALLSAFLGSSCWAQQQQPDLTDLNLADLANVQVTSASRKPEDLSTAPAAIYVLTGEAIRQGGFATLPEALRMVPGLYVAQTDDHNWQVSARGFSDVFNNKMLVLVDGRGIYSQFIGGVYWDTLDIPLENIDRVEVIRGPGGTLWGADAVNGVINIVTKNAAEAQGVTVATSVDPEQGYSATVREGGRFWSGLNYYVFGRASYWQPFASPHGGDPANHFGLPQAGLRLDWTVSGTDSVTIEGGAYDGRFRSTRYTSGVVADFLLKGNHALVRWKHTLSERSSTETMAYCDWFTRTPDPGDSRNNCEMELQNEYEISGRHSLIWGGSFFSTGDDLTVASFVFPRRRRNNVASGFAQYGIVVVPKRLRIIGASTLERNGYTGLEYQPQVRAVWTPFRSSTFWTSFSRAVSVPTRAESDVFVKSTIPGAGPGGEDVIFEIAGNSHLQSEHLKAYEGGYRFELSHSLSFDLALYYNQYSNRIVLPETIEMLSNALLIKFQDVNHGTDQSHGGDLSAQWRPVSRWTLSAAVTETRGSPGALEATPKHLFNLQSRLDLPHRVSFDTSLYHCSAVPFGRIADYPNVPSQSVSAFNRVDVGGSWRVRPEWTLGVWGRNLQSDKHLETRDSLLANGAKEVPRSVILKLTWQSKPESK